MLTARERWLGWVIAGAYPEITKLGDKSDTPTSHVTIEGKHFMGPFDGGWNRVFYRPTQTAHLSVSRTRIDSWVPAIGYGAASVTVKTQDGKSNAAAFKVDKPWWHFW